MFEIYVSKSFGMMVLVSATVMDLVFGDKDHPFHPVRLMGAAISWGEKRARAFFENEFVAGMVMSLFLVLFTFITVKFILAFAFHISMLLLFILSVIAIYYGLCLKCLADEVKGVAEALLADDLDLARRRLSMLVSRQTQDMDKTSVARGAIETIAENFVDGVSSPFFFAALGGPAMCLSFKMISTLDSMIGYKTPRYFQFGKFAARMDDAANFVPSRLSAPTIAIAGWLWKKRPFLKTISAIFRDAKHHESPNSGIPEAAFAHVLGVRLGGPVVYHGTLRQLPYINESGKDPVSEDVFEAIKLLYICSFLFYFLSLFFLVVII